MATTDPTPRWARIDPWKPSEVPDSMRLSREWINQNPANQQQVQRRRARAQEIVLRGTAYAHGEDTAAQLANMLTLYPNMSPTAMTGLVYGETFTPRVAKRIPYQKDFKYGPIRDDYNFGTLALADMEQQVASGTMNAAKSSIPEQDLPPGLIGRFIDVVSKPAKMGQFLTTGLTTGLGYGLQSYQNLRRKYYGDIDAALDLKARGDLTDDQWRNIIGEDMYKRVRGESGFDFESLLFGDTQNVPDLINQVREFGDIKPPGADDTGMGGRSGEVARAEWTREGAEVIEGSPEARAAWAAKQWRERGLGTFSKDSLWRRTALGEWFNGSETARNPLEKFVQMSDGWLGMAEYQAVDEMERTYPGVDPATGLPDPTQGMAGGKGPVYDIYTEKQKQERAAELQRRLQKASEDGFRLAAEEMYALTSARPYTTGRAAMMTIDEDPNSMAQKYGSGMIDFMYALMDPAAFVPLGKVTSAAKLRTLKAVGSKGKTVTVGAMREAAERPAAESRAVGDMPAAAAGLAGVSPDTAAVAKQVLKLEDELAQQTAAEASRRAANKSLQFDEKGRAFVVDEAGERIGVTTGVRTVVGEGWNIGFRSRRFAEDVTVGVEPVVSKGGEARGYRVTRLRAGADKAKTVKRFATVEEADEFAKQMYLRDAESLPTDVAPKKGGEPFSPEAGTRVVDHLAQQLVATRRRRAQSLRMKTINQRRWAVVDDSLDPFTEVHVRRDPDIAPPSTVTVGRTTRTIRKQPDGTYGVFDGDTLLTSGKTRKAAEDLAAQELNPYAKGAPKEVRFKKNGDDVWEARGYSIERRVTRSGNTAYFLTRFSDPRRAGGGRFTSLKAAKAAATRHAATSRKVGQGVVDETVPTTRFSVYNGQELVDTFDNFDKAAEAAKRAARTANNDLEKRVERALGRVQGESQFDEGVAMIDDAGNDVLLRMDQDAEARLLDEFTKGDAAATAKLAEAFDEASRKLSTEEFVTNQAMWDVLENTVFGQKLVEVFMKTNSASKLKRRFSFLDMDDAMALEKAVDEDTVKALLSQMIGPKYDPAMFKATTGLRRAVLATKYKLGNNKFTNPILYRPFLFAPEGRTVDLTDANHVYWEARRFGEGLGVAPDTMDTILDQILQADNPVARFETFYGKNGMLERTIRDHLKSAGVADEVIDEAINVYEGAANIGQRKRRALELVQGRPGAIVKEAGQDDLSVEERTVQELVDGTYAGPLITGISPEEYLFSDELLSKGMTLPDYREIKRILSPVGRVEGKLWGNPVVAKSVGQALGAATSIWRNATLISGARAVRDTLDMQVRIALAGGPSLLTSPIGFVGTVFTAALTKEAATKTRAFMINLPLLGLPSLLKAVNRRLPNMDDQMFRNAFIVTTDSAKSLIDPARLADDYTDAAPWQQRVFGAKGKARREGETLTREQMKLNVSKEGVVEPIEVVYDPKQDAYAVLNGQKRLIAADEAMATHIPVKITKGTIPDGTHMVAKAEDTPWGQWKGVAGDEKGFVGGVEDTVKRARAAVAKDRHMYIGMLGLSPLLDRQWALVNGDAFFGDVNKVLTGGEPSYDDMTLLSRQTSTAMGSLMTDESLRAGRGTAISEFARKNRKQTKKYAEALADRLGELHHVPYLTRLLAGDMDIKEAVHLIMKNPKERANYNAMYQSMTKKAGKAPTLEETLQVLKTEDASLGVFIESQLQAGLAAYGLYSGKSLVPEIADAFLSGEFAGKGLSSKNRAFVKFLKKEAERGDDSPLPLTVFGAERTVLGRADALVDRLFTAQGEVYDLYSMHPMQRHLYMQKVTDLIKYASPEARRKIVKNVARRGDRKLANKVADAAGGAWDADGWLSMEDVFRIADRDVTDKMRKIFYDAHGRQNYALALRVVMPFLQSAVNTVETWGRLIAKDPRHGYRAFKTVKSLMMPDSDAVSELLGFTPDEEDPYAMGTGFFSVDPMSGERSFNYPILGQALGWLVPGLEAQASASSLNPWQSGIIPGFSPIATAPLLAVDPDAPAENNLMGKILRLQGVNASDEEGRAQQAMQQLIPLKWSEMLLLGSRKKSEVYLNTLAAEMASGGYDYQNDESALRDAMDKAQSKSWLVQFLEGVLQLAMPTAGSFNMRARVDVGPVDDVDVEGWKPTGGVNVDTVVKSLTLRELSEQYKRYVSVVPDPKNPDKIEFKTGDDYRQGQAAFLRDYGAAALAGVQRIVDDDLKSPWTLEAWDYSQKKPQWWNRYRNVVAGIFPAQDSFKGSVDARIRQMQNVERSKGRGQYLSVEDINDAVLSELADLWQANALRQASAVSGGFIDPSTEWRIRHEANLYSNGASDEYDFERNEKDLDLIKKALEDPDAPQNEGTQMVLDWLRMRLSNLEYMTRAGLNKGTEAGNPTSFGSLELYGRGLEYVNRDKSGTFAAFWTRYGRKEFSEEFYALVSGNGG